MNIRGQLSDLLLFRPGPESILSLLATDGRQKEGLARLAALGETLGLSGDLWRHYLTWELLTNENPWSLGCEGRGDQGGSLSALAEQDLAEYQALLGGSGLDDVWTHYETAVTTPAGEKVRSVSEQLGKAASPAEAKAVLAEFYRSCGAGRFALDRAFRAGEAGALIPVRDMTPVYLSGLVGYEVQKGQLRENTEAFLAGREANHVLLYGDAGTGKSTCVRSLLSEYPDSPLRMIELRKNRFDALPELLAALRQRRLRFILFIDDLSFEEQETEYKSLKAAIEGGLETMPENVLIYATSNRRHLVRETWNDRSDMEFHGDVHRSDTVEEKLSLAARFGVTISFSQPDRKLYHEIVKALAERELPGGVDEAELLLGANAWEIRHGGVSGRTAQQYIDHLAGERVRNCP
ncbi:MAG: ATP-binding protein [Oscillospiraceae bacterium]|nr:ATP-binding protein [Oscillospiraceae bacterium]